MFSLRHSAKKSSGFCNWRMGMVLIQKVSPVHGGRETVSVKVTSNWKEL